VPEVALAETPSAIRSDRQGHGPGKRSRGGNPVTASTNGQTDPEANGIDRNGR
jgi:hypothetical protein